MAKIRLENVTKVYKGGVRAVSDASLEIHDKEFIVFVGPSGCGKSTTLRMIAGLEEITSGNIFIGDTYVNDLEPKDRNIAMVFQNYALYPHMSVYENLAYSLRCQKAKKEVIEEKVHKAATILGIENLLKRTPRELSGGQRQRVALGRAIVREPAAFLFDEPLSNLDAKLRVAMRAEISKLHQDIQTTFVYVTHDQTEAMTMGDRIVVMKDGLIQQVDTPMNLYDHPGNIFVATFLGSPQMNIFEGTIVKKGEEKHFISLDESIDILIPDVELCQIDERLYPLEAYLGIRPNDIKIETEGFPVEIELVERLGEQTLVYFHLGGRKEFTILSLVEPNSLAKGGKIKVRFDVGKLHLFDKKSEKNLSNAVPIIEMEIEKANLTANEKAQLDKRLINQSRPKSIAFLASNVKTEAEENAHRFTVKVEGEKDYGDKKTYYGRDESLTIIPFLTDKPFRKGQKVDLYVQLDHLNYTDDDGERISDDEPVNDHVYPATLTFRPRGCFLSEAELHNDEKCYKTIRSVRLGKKTLLHLEGAETKQKLLYLVDSSDLIYSSLPIYMRKKRKNGK